MHQFCTRANAERRRSAASVERISAALDGAADAQQALPSLTAALRVQIMTYFRAAATEGGHMLVGHGRADVADRRPQGRQAPVYQSG